MTLPINGVKSVLVGVSEDDSDEPSAAIGYALAMTATMHAHLFVVASSHRVSLAATPRGAATMGGLNAEEIQRKRETVDTATEIAAMRAGWDGTDCPTDRLQVTVSDFAARFVAHARVHDIAILDLAPSALSSDRQLIEQVLLRGGKPLILVPPRCAWVGMRRVLIAWDASAEAARAVADSLPFLKAAQTVEILCVIKQNDNARTLGRDLERMLNRHDLKPTLDVRLSEWSAAHTILQRANAGQFDLLVMGGYHHTRAQEWILGGVTQSALSNSLVPVLLSH